MSGRSGKSNGGMGRGEELFLRLHSLTVLGGVMVQAVPGVILSKPVCTHPADFPAC